MKIEKSIDANMIQRLHAILDELALPLTADASSVRRLHDAAKAITALADSIGRHERVGFNEVWPKSMADKEIGRICLPLFLGLTSTDEKLVVDLASLPRAMRLQFGEGRKQNHRIANKPICSPSVSRRDPRHRIPGRAETTTRQTDG